MTDAAAALLRAGGNAFDAAVGAGFAAAVAEPALTSLGGGGFLLARSAARAPVLFDFFVDTPGRGRAGDALEPELLPVIVRFPGSEQVFHVGPGSVAVPGMLRGLLTVHEQLGRLPLAEVVQPAIALARAGIELNARQAYFLDLLRPIKTLTETGRRLYAPGGRYLSQGDTFVNPDLADFLEALPGGADRDVYEGELATATASELAEGGGLLTAADLAGYQVVERRPLEVDYRGYRLLTNPPPSFGGVLLALGLRLLEAENPSALRFGQARHLALLAGVMREVDRLRELDELDLEARTAEDWRASRERVRQASGGTTHVSICDDEGSVASMTTSNGEGSGHFIPGTGVMLNNMMGEDDLHPDGFHASPPGQRVASMMAPSILLRDGGVNLVLGSGGSKRIRTALLQTVSAVVDFGLDVLAAVESPRVHWDGLVLQVEPGYSPREIAQLGSQLDINVWDVRDVYFGGVNAVSPAGAAAADPRRGGSAQLL